MTGEPTQLHLTHHTPPVYQLLSEKQNSHYVMAVFNPLPTSMNQEVFEKQLK